MATAEEVEATLRGLITQLEAVDPSQRSLLPSKRTLEARCPDLGLSYHAFLVDGELSELHEGSPRRADIRITVSSDDLLAMANRELTFRRAYTSNRIRLEASMTDLLRLRAVL